MIKIIITFLAICFCASMYAQMPLKSKGFTRTQHGYLMYVNTMKQYVKFVPVNSDSISNDLSNFEEKNLGVGIQMNHYKINLDSLNKFGRSYKLENFGSNSVSLVVIPITLTYSIGAYAVTRQQMEKSKSLDEYKISNKIIKVNSIGEFRVNIISSDPKIYYYDSWE